MAYRSIDCGTWDDPWFAELPPIAKLLFLYLVTNRRVSQCGAMEITVRQIAFETGISAAALPDEIRRLGDRVQWWPDDNLLIVRNFYRRQRSMTGDKFEVSARRAAATLPEFARQWLYGVYPELSTVADTHPIPTPSGIDAHPISTPVATNSHAISEAVAGAVAGAVAETGAEEVNPNPKGSWRLRDSRLLTMGNVSNDAITALLGAEGGDAKSFQEDVARQLVSCGYQCELEVKIPDRGDGRPGFLDIVARRGDVVLAVECDRVSERQKSIRKLESFDATAWAVLMREEARDRVRGSRIPDDFTVDDGMRAWAAAKGFSLPEIEHHTEAFCTYWRSESGAKATKVDWSQAWRTWFLREKPGKWPGASGTARSGAFGRASPDDIPPMGTEAFRNYEASVRYVAGMSVRPDWDGTDGRGNIVRRIERTADGAAAPIPGPGAGGAIAAARPGGRASPVGIAAD